MKKKEIKKTKLKPRTKAKTERDQFTVVLEDIRHQFDTMSEGFSGVHKKIDELNKKVDNNHKETNNHFKTLFKFRNETDTNFKTLFKFKDETNANFKTLFKFRSETNANFKTNFKYLLQIDDELQLMKIEIADLKIVFKGKVELKRIIKIEEQIVVMQEQVDTLMMV